MKRKDKINPITRSHRIRLHRTMWRWLRDNPEMDKSNWPGWEKYTAQSSDCFACGHGNCNLCPFIWPMNNAGLFWCADGGLYTKWNWERDMEKRSGYAGEIAELPVNQNLDKSI